MDKTLLSHLASLYPTQPHKPGNKKTDNGEVTLQTASPPPEANRSLQAKPLSGTVALDSNLTPHSTFEVLLNDPRLLAVNKPSGLPTLPAAAFGKNTLCALAKANSQRQTCPPVGPSHLRHRPLAKTPQAASNLNRKLEHAKIQKIYGRWLKNIAAARRLRKFLTPIRPPYRISAYRSVWAANPERQTVNHWQW